MNKNINFINPHLEREAKNFLNNFLNSKESMNPHWKEINSSVSEVSLEMNFQEIANHLNKKKLTKYLNKQFPDQLFKELKNRNFDYEEEPLAKGTLNFLLSLKKNLLDEYLDTLKEFNWKPTLVNGRHFYYSYLIRNYIINKKKIKILEIGGGTGMLVSFLRKYFDIDYVNVDFAEMIILNAYENQNKSQIKFIHNINDFSNIFHSNTCRYMIPKIFLDNVKNFKKFDLYLNTHSFMEMDEKIRDKYIFASSKILKRNGLFFNANWVQKKMSNIDQTHYNNDPHMYPYPINLKTKLYQEDQHHKYLRINSGYKPKGSLGFVNLSQKNKNLLDLPIGLQLLY